MLRSMTGFGEASGESDGIHFHVEIRSLNNKFFKTSIRLPDELQGLEPEIDTTLRKRLIRGSITLSVRCSDTTAHAAYEINTEALQHYLEQLKSLPENLACQIHIDPSMLGSLPGVLMPPSDQDQSVDRYRDIILDLVKQACDSVRAMRHREGVALLTDLEKHRQDIEVRLKTIIERAPLVIEEYHRRLKERIETMLQEADAAVGEVDLIREVAVFADRSDINEEVTRLTAHLTQFHELIDAASDEPIGRTLDFLAQELLREANTISSKSNDADISRNIVEIKGAIDRIKEQVQNVE